MTGTAGQIGQWRKYKKSTLVKAAKVPRVIAQFLSFFANAQEALARLVLKNRPLFLDRVDEFVLFVLAESEFFIERSVMFISATAKFPG